MFSTSVCVGTKKQETASSVHVGQLFFPVCGAPTWVEAPPEVPVNDVHVRVWHFASDAGPDQVACEKIVEQETGASPFDIHVHEYCLFHKVQLIIMKILKVDGLA